MYLTGWKARIFKAGEELTKLRRINKIEEITEWKY